MWEMGVCIVRGGRVKWERWGAEWERWVGGAGEVGGWSGRGGRMERERWVGGAGEVGRWSRRGA